MRRAGNRSTAETDAAGYEALKGGIAGAAKVQQIPLLFHNLRNDY